jgi:hypothetical protein
VIAAFRTWSSAASIGAARPGAVIFVMANYCERQTRLFLNRWRVRAVSSSDVSGLGCGVPTVRDHLGGVDPQLHSEALRGPPVAGPSVVCSEEVYPGLGLPFGWAVVAPAACRARIDHCSTRRVVWATDLGCPTSTGHGCDCCLFVLVMRRPEERLAGAAASTLCVFHHPIRVARPDAVRDRASRSLVASVQVLFRVQEVASNWRLRPADEAPHVVVRVPHR